MCFSHSKNSIPHDFIIPHFSSYFFHFFLFLCENSSWNFTRYKFQVKSMMYLYKDILLFLLFLPTLQHQSLQLHDHLPFFFGDHYFTLDMSHDFHFHTKRNSHIQPFYFIFFAGTHYVVTVVTV